MPHLYLPTEHTDKDLVLAADVAAAVSSADLYVSWTIDSGAGAPEVEAVVREERPVQPPNPFVDLFVAVFQGIAAFWRSLTGPPAPRVAASPRRRSPAPRASRSSRPPGPRRRRRGPA
jgi:hypothetical protein